MTFQKKIILFFGYRSITNSIRNFVKFLVLATFLIFFSFLETNGQFKLDSNQFLSKKALIGVWQYNTSIIGDALRESFRFYKDGRFEYSYEPEDDTRNIIGFEGIYRIKKQILFITIKSRDVVDGGKIDAGSNGTDDYLFVFNNKKIKKILEKDSSELDFLLLFKDVVKSKLVIKINNRTYFKLSPDPGKFLDN